MHAHLSFETTNVYQLGSEKTIGYGAKNNNNLVYVKIW